MLLAFALLVRALNQFEHFFRLAARIWAGWATGQVLPSAVLVIRAPAVRRVGTYGTAQV
ncbi:MAG TPA: hypothetical protein VGM32_07710 [Rhodopila sp.]